MTCKNIKTGELVKYEFEIADKVVFTKDWEVYQMSKEEFYTQYTYVKRFKPDK